MNKQDNKKKKAQKLTVGETKRATRRKRRRMTGDPTVAVDTTLTKQFFEESMGKLTKKLEKGSAETNGLLKQILDRLSVPPAPAHVLQPSNANVQNGAQLQQKHDPAAVLRVRVRRRTQHLKPEK
jgi:hypothetical protein